MRRGFALIEIAFLMPVVVAGTLLAIFLINSVSRSQKMAEAEETVRLIAKSLHGIVHNPPENEEQYKALLRQKRINPTNPWGGCYRMIVYSGLLTGQGLCYTNNAFLGVRAGQRTIRNVLYVAWTETPASEKGINTRCYDRMSGTVQIPKQSIYEVFTLDMYKTLYCREFVPTANWP